MVSIPEKCKGCPEFTEEKRQLFFDSTGNHLIVGWCSYHKEGATAIVPSICQRDFACRDDDISERRELSDAELSDAVGKMWDRKGKPPLMWKYKDTRFWDICAPKDEQIDVDAMENVGSFLHILQARGLVVTLRYKDWRWTAETLSSSGRKWAKGRNAAIALARLIAQRPSSAR